MDCKVFLGILILFFSRGGFGFDIANETKLRLDLLGLYNLKVRPSAVTKVNLVFNLLTINELLTRTQTLTLSGFFTVVWSDKRLAWKKADYNGIGFIFGDETEMWRPALVVKNAVTNLNVISNVEVPFRVLHSGKIFWNPPGIFQVHCELDTTYYPFDTQTCSMSIQSWGYNLRELNLAKYGSGVKTGEYTTNGEWDLLDAYSQRAEKVHGVDAESYATVSFVFQLQRKSEYYGLNIILPVVVLSVLSALVFLLPADSGEKMGFSLTVLLAFAVFLTLIADRMPSTSTYTSYMAVYLSVTLCMSGLSIFLTVLVLDLHCRETPVPKAVEVVVLHYLQPLLCIQGCRRFGNAGVVSHSDTVLNSHINNIKTSGALNSHINDIKISDEKDSPSEDTLTWKDVSRTFDALFFRSYIIITVIVTVIFFSILGIGSSTDSGSTTTGNGTKNSTV